MNAKWALIGRVIGKAALLFGIVNLFFLLANPTPWLTRLSIYNTLVPGRARLPYGENPTESYSLTLTRFEPMFAAHELAGAGKKSDEYRVMLLGDSSVWGWLLAADQTLSACLNRQHWRLANGKRLRAYNLGYPVLDLTKDLLILQKALAYEPDLVVWLVTLESFYPQQQLYFEIVRAHADEVRDLIARYDLNLDPAVLPPPPKWWERSLIGQREALAGWLRLQIYGVAWAVTGIDHRNPRFSMPVRQNLQDGEGLLDGTPRTDWERDDLAFDVLAAGVRMANEGGAEMLLINEPIFRSSGLNSDLRYNHFYPRWAYDRYRELLGELAEENGWHYADLWDAAPSDQFTDTPFHLNPDATCDLAAVIGAEIQRQFP